MAKKKSVHKASGPDGPLEVSASVFKDECLQLLDRVQQTREEIVVTKYGRPVARVVPHEAGTPELYGSLAGSVTIHGDIVAPTGEQWDAAGEED